MIPIVMANCGIPGQSWACGLSRAGFGGNIPASQISPRTWRPSRSILFANCFPILRALVALVNVEWLLDGTGTGRDPSCGRQGVARPSCVLHYRTPDDLERAFEVLCASEGRGGFWFRPTSPSLPRRVRIAELAANARLPTIYFNRESVSGWRAGEHGPNRRGELSPRSGLPWTRF